MVIPMQRDSRSVFLLSQRGVGEENDGIVSRHETFEHAMIAMGQQVGGLDLEIEEILLDLIEQLRNSSLRRLLLRIAIGFCLS